LKLGCLPAQQQHYPQWPGCLPGVS